MKRLALFAAVVFAVAACAKTDSNTTDTTPAAMAPAPAMTDSAKMADSMSMKMADTTKKDTTKMKPGVKKP